MMSRPTDNKNSSVRENMENMDDSLSYSSCEEGASELFTTETLVVDKPRTETCEIVTVDKPRASTSTADSGVPTHKREKKRTRTRLKQLEENCKKQFDEISSQMKILIERTNPVSSSQKSKPRSKFSQIYSDSDSDSEEDVISIRASGRISESDSHSDAEPQFADAEGTSGAVKRGLLETFGDDAVLKKPVVKSGLAIDSAQKEVLKNSYRTDSPNSLTAFSEENADLFPVDENTEQYLQVPSLDDLVGKCLTTRHGQKAAFKKKGNLVSRQLFTQPCKMIEKIAYKGQQASRLGIIMQVYTQQSLASLVDNISKDYSKDDIINHVKNIFSMTTKCLDQIGRAGAFHHIVRRTAAMCDTALYELEDATEFSNLPLSAEGVFGKDVNNLLKSRKEKQKQMEELMPEVKKRKHESVDVSNKRPRHDSLPKPTSARNFESEKYNRYNQDKSDNFRGPKPFRRDYDSRRPSGQPRATPSNRGRGRSRTEKSASR